MDHSYENQAEVMTEVIESNIDLMYHSILQDIKNQGILTESVTDPFSIGSNFGKNPRKTKEILGCKLVLTNPRSRILFNRIRGINLPFAIANLVWNLSGCNEVSKINFFNGRGISFSDNGKTIDGSCYGKRIFNTPNGFNQIEAIVEKIKKDPASRRTFVPIFHLEDNFVNTKDVPCPIGVQYFLRNEKLHAITFMRSNSAAFVLPYNIFFFTMLQELIAKELSAEVGEYIHFCGSLHYYKDEETFVEQILTSSLPDNLEMPSMPNQGNFENIEKLASIQTDVASASNKNNEVSYWMKRVAELNPYWANFAYILLNYAFEKLNLIEERHAFLEKLDPIYLQFSKRLEYA